MEYIKRRIEQRMKELRIKQDELAGKSGVSQSTINRLLNTPIKSRIDTIQKVAKALSLPPEYLTIKNERHANICKLLYEMNDQDLQDTLFHIEKEKLWKKAKKAI